MRNDLDGDAWLARLPDELAAQRRVMAGLLGFCAATPVVTSFSVGCSLGRGAADELSDIDAALGVTDEASVGAAEALVSAALPGFGQLVDLLRYQARQDDGIRRIFAQYADRAQLDLAVVPQAKVKLAERPDFVPLYLAPGAPASAGDPAAAFVVSGEQVREWAFIAWCELLDIDKYLRRGSLWEAHDRLHDVRRHIWMLWAAATGAMYPWHGLSQVLDRDAGDLPPGIGATVATLDAADLRRAARASAALLSTASEAAAGKHPVRLPAALAGYVTALLGAADP
jgi:hypothetical protein